MRLLLLQALALSLSAILAPAHSVQKHKPDHLEGVRLVTSVSFQRAERELLPTVPDEVERDAGVLPAPRGTSGKIVSHGLMLGEYVISVDVGTPPQAIQAVIDTGSGLVHFPCHGCTGSCTNMSSFNPGTSTSNLRAACASPACQLVCGPESNCKAREACAVDSCFCKQVPTSQDDSVCLFDIQYGDRSSATGQVFTDVMQFPDAPEQLFHVALVNVTLGCDFFTQNQMFDKRAPGLLGLNYEQSSLYSQLLASGSITDSMYFCVGDGRTDETNNGVLVLGKANYHAPGNAKPVVTRLYTSKWSQPTVLLTGLRVGHAGEELLATVELPPIQALIDTGSSSLLLPSAAYQLWAYEFEKLMDRSPSVKSWGLDRSGNHIVELHNATHATKLLSKPFSIDDLLPTMYFGFEAPPADTTPPPPPPPANASAGAPAAATGLTESHTSGSGGAGHSSTDVGTDASATSRSGFAGGTGAGDSVAVFNSDGDGTGDSSTGDDHAGRGGSTSRPQGIAAQAAVIFNDIMAALGAGGGTSGARGSLGISAQPASVEGLLPLPPSVYAVHLRDEFYGVTIKDVGSGSAAPMAVLGNIFLSRLLVTLDRGAGLVTMTRVKSCADAQFD